jgi:hypothetical protein
LPLCAVDLIESWHAAKKPVECHLYKQGGRGFGIDPKAAGSSAEPYF